MCYDPDDSDCICGSKSALVQGGQKIRNSCQYLVMQPQEVTHVYREAFIFTNGLTAC